MKRKILAIFLIIASILSSVTVFAQSSQINTDFSPFLSSLGIELPANEVDLEDTQRAITKAEFVYLVVSAMGQNARLEKEYLTFPDVKLDSWYHDNLIIAASKELIYGYENGYFGVEDEVSEDVGALIILRALGFGMLPADADSQKNLIAAHSTVYSKLLKGVTRDGTISIDDAYCMIYNMLCSSYAVKNFADKDSYYVETGKMYMQDAFGTKMATGRITGNRYTSFGISGQGVGYKKVEIDGIIYETMSNDAVTYLGYYVDFCLDDHENKVLYIIPKPENEVTEISSTDLVSCKISGSNIVFEYEDEVGNNKRTTVPISCDFVYNGKAEGFTTALINDLKNNKVGEIKIVEYNNHVLVDVTAYETMIVDTVSSYDSKIYGRYGVGPVSVEEDNGGYLIIEKNGEEYPLYEIKKDDVIQYAISTDKKNIKIIVCDFTLTGAITSGVSEGEIGIDGVTYKVSNYFITKRLPTIDLKIGVKQKFLFNASGELVDIVENSSEYDGEYVFLLEAKKIRKLDMVRVKYVTMDASMVTSYLAEKVRYNGLKSMSDDVLNALLSGGKAKRQLIYINKNSDNNISVINTSDQKDIDGTFRKNDIIVQGAAEKKRKCKQQTAFLVDDNDAHFPEFYTDNNTKILRIPVSTAADDVFADETNYVKMKISDFKDAEDYIVEAYNLDDYNVADIMLLKQDQAFDSRRSNNNLIIVGSVGHKLDKYGDIVPYIKGYQSGEQIEYELKDDSVLTYINKASTITKNDVLRFNTDNAGIVTHAEYIKNLITDCGITDEPEGRNDGNAIVIGNVVSHKDDYLRLQFTSAASVRERVFRGSVSSVTVYDDGECYKGTIEDVTPKSKVLIRVYYTTLRDIIVIK